MVNWSGININPICGKVCKCEKNIYGTFRLAKFWMARETTLIWSLIFQSDAEIEQN